MVTNNKRQSIHAHPEWNAAQNLAFERLDSALPIAMSYLSGEIPVLDNTTNEMLVDEVGDLKKVKKMFEAAEKAHVERLKARIGDKDEMVGDIYHAKYRGSKRVILNQGLCKETIEAFDEEGISIQRLLKAIQDGEVTLPPECVLQDGGSNHAVFHTTADGGRSLYVDPIA